MNLSDLSGQFDWHSAMGTTVKTMRDTCFETWGFLVYHCTYGDDEAWSRYMAHFQEEYEDQVTLKGASKQQVRERFVEWKDQHSVSIELPETNQLVRRLLPMPSDASLRLPRFTYCLYVNQKCLDTLIAYLDAKVSGARPTLVTVVTDGDYSPSARASSRRRCSDVASCTDEYVGWE